MGKVLREAVKIEYPEIAIPDKPSELIREVIDDMLAVGKLRHVKFDMALWCEADLDGKCSVCAAGAWMYAKANFPKDHDEMVSIANFIVEIVGDTDDDLTVYHVMTGIDALRQSHAGECLHDLNEVYDFSYKIDMEKVSSDLGECFTRTYNEDNPRSVIAAFEKCAKVMESHGI